MTQDCCRNVPTVCYGGKQEVVDIEVYSAVSGKKIFPFPIQNTITTPLRKVSKNNNNGEFINLWAGTNFNQVRDLSAKELMKNLADELKAEN